MTRAVDSQGRRLRNMTLGPVEDGRVVLVFGGANVDIEGRSFSPLIAGDSNPGNVTRSPGGVARNIAENLARLGTPTRLYTILGDDPDGRWLHEHTHEAGVDMSGTLWIRDAPTSTYLSILDPRGEMAVAISDMDILSHLGPEQVPVAALVNAAVVVVDANLEEETLDRIFGIAADTPVFVDPVSTTKATRIGPFLDRIHTLKPNRTEAEVLSGTEITDQATLWQAAERLLEAGVARVVVTLGSEGVFYADTHGSGTIAGVRRPLASVTGAGDALMAGLVWAHLEGKTLREAVAVGTDMASTPLGHHSRPTATDSQPAQERLSRRK